MTTEIPWGPQAVRRAIRVLGSQPTPAGDPVALTRAIRLVSDILSRRGIEVEIFQVPGVLPLIVAGRGPVLVVSYLDDASPHAAAEEPEPPAIDGDRVVAAGVVRKAGLLAAIGSLLASPWGMEQLTLVVEPDRKDRSRSLEAWLHSTHRPLLGALHEVADLPIQAPAVFSGATGLIELAIGLRQVSGPAESFYGGVLPDIGHRLADLLASLKSHDAEVLVPGFYDGVDTPDPEGVRTLHEVASSVAAWLMRGTTPTVEHLSASHLTLGVFVAPSIVIRNVRVEAPPPYLPTEASATIEARVMPGQDVAVIERAIIGFIQGQVPDAQVRVVLRRPAARGGITTPLPAQFGTQVPVAAGDSSAGLLEAAGLPVLGYSTVWRDPAALEESTTISTIMGGAARIEAMARFVASIDRSAGSQR